ncbi:5-formyltetrahydrofolate cyclo-ligase [Dissulfurispira thermophila]|uniref:5-formyltetrahydrofolate cyclo-ligase n=2 Tax=root TaxID=1 RepID=A0A7G1GZF8_9BACT|nr:5-formyltetrahydrofolate cyclo-ligase [Dissulfurispira thermophila]BCB95648.1 5-formyltetrahydrofolate cyclo-ligase [Dissulfurispira thermophila]
MANKEKNLLRKEILYKRDLINKEIRKDKDRKIKERLLSLFEFEASDKILLYASFRSEVETFDLLKYCITHGKITALPKVDKDHNELKIYEVKDTKDLVKGYLGIPEPDVSEDRLLSVEHMDLILVPGVAFDEHCNRLGYGKGFYDKLLKGVRDLGLGIGIIALAYEEQVVESIPSESHDIRMDKIITDERIIECYG